MADSSVTESCGFGAGCHLVQDAAMGSLTSSATASLSSARLDERLQSPPDQLIELLPVGVCVCNAEGTLTRYNRAAAALWGRAPQLGNPSERYCGAHRFHTLDGMPLAHRDSPMAEALASGVPVRNHEIVVERPDGTRIVVLMHIDPLYDAEGGTIGAVNCFRDVTEHRRLQDLSREQAAEQAHRQETLNQAAEDEIETHRRNEQAALHLAAIVESSDDAILAKDIEGVITSWNRGAERLFGYTAEEAIGQPVTLLIPSDRQDEEPDILARIRRGERIEHYETIRQRKDGSQIAISLSVSPMKDARGRIIGASKIARDITERQRAQDQQHLLLREMDHRIKNLFTLASGVVTLSARSAKTPETLAADVRERLGALARAHALTLPKASDAAGRTEQTTTLHTLIRAILAPYDGVSEGMPSLFTIDGPDIDIATGAVSGFALLLHEFATNAAKYGALSTAAGTVEIVCAADPDRFHLTWAERGGPAVDPRRTEEEGFGSLLARMTVKGQLAGDITRDWLPEGLVIRLSVTRDRIEAAPPE
jgi:PAS domain S-box-containing protein